MHLRLRELAIPSNPPIYPLIDINDDTLSRLDYRLTDGHLLTTKKLTGHNHKDTELAFSQTTIPNDIHTANIIFTNIILVADKHNIPKGKMPSTSRLLPEHIVCKITQRDNIRRANPCDPALKPLNLEITSDISLHKQNLWKEHLNANWDHRHNTHTLWKTIHGLSNRAAPTPQNCTITFNKKIATSPKNIVNCFNKQFTNTVKHSTHKTNRSIDRAVHKLPKHTITLTTTHGTGKLLQTSTPGTILKFVVNYIKGRKAYTSFRNHKSIQRQVKTGVPQGGVLSPTLFNIPTPTAPPVQLMLYADDSTITSAHTSMSAARKYIQPYLHKVYDWTQHNNLIINPDKTTCTLFIPDPAEYNSNLGLNINYKALPMALHPKILGLTLDPKLTYNAHIQNIATHAQKPLQVIKELTGTTWGKQKKTLVATYKAVMRPTLEYASSIWSPMASPTSINKLQVMQNAALRACTGCTHDTNIHLHDETNILPIQKHLQLHASQVRQKAQYPSHPLYRYTTHNTSQLLMKPTTFNNSRYTTNRPLHCHYSRHKSKHARHTHNYCLSAPRCKRQ